MREITKSAILYALFLAYRVMKKDISIIFLGLVVVVTPFLGIPTSWKSVVFVVVGLVISWLAYLLQKEMHDVGNAGVEKGTEIFVENDARLGDGFVKTEHDESQEKNATDTKKE